MTDLDKLRTVSAQETARAALKAGFPMTCATCEHLKRAWDTNADDCGKTLTCGGPVFGRYFQDYVGPLTRQALESVCLICGSTHVDYAVFGGIYRFGLCESHSRVFDKVTGPGTQTPIVLRIPGRII